MSSISHEVSYSVQGFAGHAPNSLVNNAPALNSILKSLIGFLNFATDTIKWHIFIIKQHTDAYLTNDKITHYKWLPLIAHEDKPNNQLFMSINL